MYPNNQVILTTTTIYLFAGIICSSWEQIAQDMVKLTHILVSDTFHMTVGYVLHSVTLFLFNMSFYLYNMLVDYLFVQSIAINNSDTLVRCSY